MSLPNKKIVGFFSNLIFFDFHSYIYLVLIYSLDEVKLQAMHNFILFEHVCKMLS